MTLVAADDIHMRLYNPSPSVKHLRSAPCRDVLPINCDLLEQLQIQLALL
jgi:hypothetical protein